MQPRMQEQQDKMNLRFSEGVMKLIEVFRDIGCTEEEKTKVFAVSPYFGCTSSAGAVAGTGNGLQFKLFF